MVKRTKTLNPNSQFMVLDSNQQPISPPFFHEELAAAVMREMSKDYTGLAVVVTDAPSTAGTFHEAIKVISRENRWLNAIQKDKRYFQGLCEGWLSVQPQSLNREVAHV